MRRSVLFFIVILLWSVARLAADAAAPSTIVFITSASDIAMDYELQTAFQSRWKEREPLALILPYSLSPYAFPLTADARDRVVDSISERLKNKPPTLIVAQGDPGFFLALTLRDTRFPSSPIIAFDVVGNDERKEKYGNVPSLYVVELSEIAEKNVELAMRLFPNRKRAVILLRVGGNLQLASVLDDKYKKRFPELTIVTVPNPSQDTADAVLRTDPDNTFVIGLSPGWTDSSGRYRSGKDYVRSISDTYGVPMFEYLRSHLDGGTVGGVGILPSRWGRDAADRGLSLVFDRVEPGHWIKGADFANAFADYRELRRFGSSADLLPVGSELINVPPPAWIRYQRVLQPLLMVLILAVAVFTVRSVLKRRENEFLLEANARLEKEVSARTEELLHANEDLAASNANLTEAIRRTQEMQENVLRSAREITLGRFTAGIANGLNSPLNAVHSASTALRSVLCEDEDGLVAKVLILDEEQRSRFVRYARRTLEKPSREPTREKTVELEKLLDGLGCDDAGIVAADLSEAGLVDLGREELKDFADEKGRDVARNLYRLSVLERSAWIIEQAAERAADIIRTVREYASDTGAGAETSRVNLRDTVERALLLFKNRLPATIALRSDYDEVPPIFGSEATLVRVWASLVQNAIQAMPLGGALEVSLRRNGDYAEVSVADEGEGIDPLIADRLFEPFVTTRAMAEGMGLGLAFCKRAIESSGGSIGYAVKERGTVFSVRLPIGGAL